MQQTEHGQLIIRHIVFAELRRRIKGATAPGHPCGCYPSTDFREGLARVGNQFPLKLGFRR